jgi:hypothetical protein
VEFARRYALPQVVSLDFHTRRQFFPLGLSLQLDGPVTRESVLLGLRAGRFEPVFSARSALAFTAGVAERALQALEQARRHAAARIRRRS